MEGEDSKVFAVRVGIHQGSVLSGGYLCCGDGCDDRGGGEGGTCHESVPLWYFENWTGTFNREN